MKLFNTPLYIPLSKEMETLFKEETRKRFMPFLRAALFIYACLEFSGIVRTYFASGQFTILDMRLWSSGFYFSLFLATYIPFSYKIANAFGVVGILGAVLSLAFLLSFDMEEFKILWAAYFIPLQLIPLMTSFLASFITIWMAITIVLDFVNHSALSAQEIDSIKNILFYYGAITIAISYLTNQYRRSSFLLEQHLEHAREDAEAANEAKSAFLATMSHEVRTPLNGILGLVTLAKDTRLDRQQKDYIETIKYSGEALLTILNDILDFSKMEAGKFDLEYMPFNVERLVKSVVTLMQSRAEEKGLKFYYEIDDEVPLYLESDPTRVRQVLLNLIGNAIKFTEQGSIRIAVSVIEKKTSEAIIRFDVSDTGIGISDEAAGKLFQEFSQADSSVSRKYGGTGLGLSICKKIIELMEGEIGINSKEGVGSTFWFEIPADIVEADQTEIDIMEEGDELAVPDFSPLQVLVAEDNVVNQKVITGLLERCGLGVTIAGNGKEAVTLLQRADSDFDVVMMDMQMPVMDGLTASAEIRALKNENRHIPIIALTANAVKGDEQRCLVAGMNGYVSKPINPGAFYRAIVKYVPNAVKDSGKLRKPIILEQPEKRNYENLENIESTLGREYVKEFVGEGLKEIKGLVDRIYASSDSQDMKRATHDLKSLSGMFGLDTLEALAEGIEMCCAENSSDEASLLAKSLLKHYQDDVAALEKNYLSVL